MELRDIEIFLALAEELHFGRTAERLHLTPSGVSHAIKKQERRVGKPLFDRTSRSVRLTPAGEQLYQTLRPAYQAIIDGIEGVSAAAEETGGTLTLGTIGAQGLMINDLVERFRKRHPAIELVHRGINPVDPLTPLREGEVDVLHLWLPVREPDITVGPITHTSPIVVIMSGTHPYAERESLSLEDYGDMTFVVPQSQIPASMEEAWQPFRTPSGRLIPRQSSVSSWDDMLKTVSVGPSVIATPAEGARYCRWPNLAYIPVRDAPPVQWAFAWLSSNPNPLIRTLAAAVDETDQDETDHAEA
ncbi:LysR family transcriptional regulator [Actinomadura barringtoniae]|uniref:LysR family transcriptional regulator n=1 Tax=Actinomadura barringtoniae TaxID=1427535 RepID=A0A939PHT9_9ACTN|nr:LysR family transcriptional regulator [Actinomadura barringtoniae]MBO2453147.1 LysR family transcriptional regulator [Actinomadura barringtoniae]